MSYPAAERQYTKRCAEMRQLINDMQEEGINLEEILRLFEQLSQNYKQHEYERFIELIKSKSSYLPLLEKAQNWKQSYDNLMSELGKWNEEGRGESNSSPINYSNSHSPNWSPDDFCQEFDSWTDYLDGTKLKAARERSRSPSLISH
jgi:DNA-binding transcriptional MerR regulator